MESHALRSVRYRNRAALVRIVAEAMKGTVARVLLLSVAQDYLSWAETLERERQKPGGDSPDLSVVKTQHRA